MLRRKTAIIFALCALLSPTLAFGQTATAKTIYTAPPETIARIKEEGGKNSQVMQTLSYLTDVIGARLTGSPQLKRANEWTRDQMAKWGLQNAKLEAWGPFGRGWTLKSFDAEVVAPYSIPLIAYPKAWSPSTKGAVTGDVVYFDAKSRDTTGLEQQATEPLVAFFPQHFAAPSHSRIEAQFGCSVPDSTTAALTLALTNLQHYVTMTSIPPPLLYLHAGISFHLIMGLSVFPIMVSFVFGLS